MPSDDQKFPHVPRKFYNAERHIHYNVEKYLGKGGFAKVYEFHELLQNRVSRSSASHGLGARKTGNVFAGKLVPMNLLQKQGQKEKMRNEINLHKMLKHHNIVGFIDNFKYDGFVVIILELCTRNSLMELSKRRKTLLEPEARYYMSGLVEGMRYIHANQVIHRDLKLSNVFLDEKLTVKIGDFGLAVECDSNDNRKTICGTPNYLAPEILEKEGHNFPVDVWALGVILFTLLNGKPPFETSSIKSTYERIKKVSYHMPPSITPEAKHLINQMLQRNPNDRPRVCELKKVYSKFYDKQGNKQKKCNWFSLWTPNSLPISSMTTEPRFDEEYFENDQENVDPNNFEKLTEKKQVMENNNRGMLLPRFEEAANHREIHNTSHRQNQSIIRHKKQSDLDPITHHLPRIIQMLENVLRSKPYSKPNISTDDTEAPRKKPVFYIAKWVDFEHKYGFGYTLSEGHYGVNFNDEEKIVMNANGVNFVHIKQDLTEYHYSHQRTDEWPNHDRSAMKKITLMSHIIRYMNKQLQHAGGHRMAAGDGYARIPNLSFWKRIDTKRPSDSVRQLTNSAPHFTEGNGNFLQPGSSRDLQNYNNNNNNRDNLMQNPPIIDIKKRHQSAGEVSCFSFLLTNGTLQCNFSDSHVKVIICPLMEAVTFLNFTLQDGEELSHRTFCLEAIMKYGCRREIYDYLKLCFIAAKKVYEECRVKNTMKMR